MHEEVIHFWFSELAPDMWRTKSPELDDLMRARFAVVHRQAEQGELWRWRQSTLGRLAEIIVLDQLSRNLWRGTARAFASDGMALVLAQEAIARGADQELPNEQRLFMYMPFMHSESLSIHERALALFGTLSERSLEDELKHLRIVRRFGRYPHRNAILGRTSTPEELSFLEEPGSSF